ncbi:MAG: glycosyltransferase family 4 protein [Leptolyngbyaceae cyanobacterium SL_7_1]|nr:glycosyltransferase family 4 protein [Leptolyngbyaceae cyanobacterium SL_7_1]
MVKTATDWSNVHPLVSPANILCVGLGWFPTNPGGLDRYVYELTHHLALAGDRVELAGVGLPPADPTAPIHLHNLANPDSSTWKRLWTARANFSTRLDTQLDAINLHFALYGLPLLGQLPDDVPVTFTFHGPWALESKREGAKWLSYQFKHWVEQRVFQRCDRFLVLSQAFGTILHKEFRIPWDQIHVIPGGVDTTRFQPTLSRSAARAQLGWQGDRKILFTPRRLVHRMGIDRLLTAVAAIKSSVPEVWLAIAGKGALREALEQQAQALGLEHHVQFLGFLPDEQLPIAYQAADLTIMPSQSLEGFGLVLLESLACGTPALCTPVGGMPEVIAPFNQSLITESTEAGALAERLRDLLLCPGELPDRETCRNYAVTHFNWYKIAQDVRKILLL